MREMVVYAPLGCLGYGFPAHSLEAAMAKKPAVLAVDAGSTDPGPYYLGAGVSYTNRTMVKRDLSLIIPAALDTKVPFIIGTAGGAGGRPHLEWVVDIVRELAAERGLHFRAALIEGEIDKTYVQRKLAAGDIIDFEAPRPLTTEDIARSTRIVGQMGHEPIIRALEAGVEGIIAGRAYDAALTAALPIREGYDLGLTLHMGKILECGSLVALPRESDGAIGYIRDDHFLIEPADPYKRCTVETVAAHTLYEKSNPLHLAMPGGTLDLSQATFAQHDERTVRVAGSRFIPNDTYTIKLEGAALVGYRSVCVAGTRDPIMIRQIDEVIDAVKRKIRRDLAGIVPEKDYQILYHIYGKDGVMGALEPQKEITSHELGLVIEVVAKTPQLADTVSALARSATLHAGYQGRIATAGNLAFPFSPAEFPAPPVYEFSVYHLMRVDDPCEPFPMRIVEI